ncbi:RNA 2',3'-cyclic phosphodiesterase [Sphingomonas bacterium]|uniref:RNA 2',3'-cyclic phosphodiesterase n=1 Tax=Sphingomonas bacterium TaxID=1895847 RepID=UPI001575628B
MSGIDGARWQDDEQLHLTLRFIGEVTATVADDLTIALSRIFAVAPVLSIAGVGRFEKRGRTDALWAAVAPAETLAAMHRKVDRACVAVGLSPEGRAYRPHVTLARLPRAGHDEAQVGAWLVRHAALSSAPFVPSHLILYESRLGRDGATYEPVMRWPLGTGETPDGSQ